MALLPAAVGSPTGSAVVPRLPVNGDTITPGDDVQMVFFNGSGSPITVTVTAVQVCSQGALHNLVAVVAAGATSVLGPIDRRYANASTGLAVVNYTGTLTGTTAYTTRV
jgi:hypothetical protein